MTKLRVGSGLAAGLLLAWSAAALAAKDPPSVAEMLQFRPLQEGVAMSTPTAQELAGCKVELYKKGKGSGWLLRDGHGLPLRRFFDSRYVETGGKSTVDVWSYYKDGLEVYRELRGLQPAKGDQYRWLGSNGMKWGVDEKGEGKITTWKIIAPEEVSQEIVSALVKNDFARFQALLISEAEIKALDLPADHAARIREQHKQARAKFEAAAAKLALSSKAQWIHLETAPPNCVPGDAVNSKFDLIRHKSATIVVDNAGKNEFIQTGEIIQVGLAWRLADAPTPGAIEEPVASPGAGTDATPEVKALLDELNKHDATPMGTSPAELRAHNLKRAHILENIVRKVKAEDYEQWIRQIADSLSTAMQNSPASDSEAHTDLQRWVKYTSEQFAGTNLAAYVTYREMSAVYARRLKGSKQEEYDAIQNDWIDKLTKFVAKYPKAEDTPDAHMQLGMVNEFLGKEVPAKNWYKKLSADFPDHSLAAKARGAEARLESEGKELQLAGPTLDGRNADIAALRGKVVFVYYWASWNEDCETDFNKLNRLQTAYGSKGFEVLYVNLDDTAKEANAMLAKVPANGAHLFQPGGHDSPLAVQYGVVVLPQSFLVDKDGKVKSRSLRVGALENELKNLLK
jgi:thiol-disulfide isomerase/thioredoxin